MALHFSTRRLLHVAFCILSPLGLLFPWVVFGGVQAYDWVEWLTKYPDFGPINLEVGLGILCMLVCSLLPFGFGMYYIFGKVLRRNILVMLLVAELVFFLPVFT
jgi:hypothetical protein